MRLVEHSVNPHRLFITSWRLTGASACATVPLEAFADARGARGDLAGHCGATIDPLDGENAGPFGLDGELGSWP